MILPPGVLIWSQKSLGGALITIQVIPFSPPWLLTIPLDCAPITCTAKTSSGGDR